jgi:hypothetical protein
MVLASSSWASLSTCQHTIRIAKDLAEFSLANVRAGTICQLASAARRAPAPYSSQGSFSSTAAGSAHARQGWVGIPSTRATPRRIVMLPPALRECRRQVFITDGAQKALYSCCTNRRESAVGRCRIGSRRHRQSTTISLNVPLKAVGPAKNCSRRNSRTEAWAAVVRYMNM